MKLFRHDHSISNFTLCLGSAKILTRTNFKKNRKFAKNSFHLHREIIHNINIIRKKPIQERLKLKHIIITYDWNNKKYLQLDSKIYKQRFLYQYFKDNKYAIMNRTFQDNALREVIHLIALKYIYIIYKLLKARHSTYIYYLLIFRQKRS